MVWSFAVAHNKQLYDEETYEFQNLIKSADNAYPQAMFMLSSYYIYGKSPVGDYKENWHIERSKEKAEYYLKKLEGWLKEHDDATLQKATSVLREQIDAWDYSYDGGNDSGDLNMKKIIMVVIIAIVVIFVFAKVL